MNEIQIPFTIEFRKICKEIVDMNFSEIEWAASESDDLFQTNSFEGGFDATEKAFTFSYFQDDKEYWFQLTLQQVSKINEGHELILKGKLADTLI